MCFSIHLLCMCTCIYAWLLYVCWSKSVLSVRLCRTSCVGVQTSKGADSPPASSNKWSKARDRGWWETGRSRVPCVSELWLDCAGIKFHNKNKQQETGRPVLSYHFCFFPSSSNSSSLALCSWFGSSACAVTRAGSMMQPANHGRADDVPSGSLTLSRCYDVRGHQAGTQHQLFK